jgi:hypothetical protein
MKENTNNRQYVRQLTLPSGRRIEVVYFEGQEATEKDHSADLHLCGTCGCELVYPIDWEPVGKSFWRVTLRCPNCEWSGTGVFEQDAVDRFDAELDRGTETLTRELERLSLANMVEDIERFVSALNAGHIIPADF